MTNARSPSFTRVLRSFFSSCHFFELCDRVDFISSISEDSDALSCCTCSSVSSRMPFSDLSVDRSPSAPANLSFSPWISLSSWPFSPETLVAFSANSDLSFLILVRVSSFSPSRSSILFTRSSRSIWLALDSETSLSSEALRSRTSASFSARSSLLAVAARRSRSVSARDALVSSSIPSFSVRRRLVSSRLVTAALRSSAF
mmetsp:Transcript_7513/g.16375  ORF Transcript_7513/g.16375 Transcript_7513/m.16375 type:complete len:201 (+) Transcript_7513:493-1095(+)